MMEQDRLNDNQPKAKLKRLTTLEDIVIEPKAWARPNY